MLPKTRLNTREVLISVALIDSDISHDKFDSVNVLGKYIDMKGNTENLKSINSDICINMYKYDWYNNRRFI